jgi:signal transduction histidine kinase
MSEPPADDSSTNRPDSLDALRAVTAGLAHEIRNPLQFIKNYAEVVAELASELQTIASEAEGTVSAPMFDDLTSLRTELGQAGEQIVRHVGRLDAIVESMLAASHHGSGHRQLTDLNLLVRESAEFAYHGRVGAPAAPRVERLEFDLEQDLPLVVVDPLRLSRAVINLVANALQALAGDSAALEPAVTVRTGRVPNGISISVADNGPGIAADVQPRVFEPFFTGKSGRHHAGLGLTQVWDIVVGDHGGSVTIEGRGPGTIATITLPEPSDSG